MENLTKLHQDYNKLINTYLDNQTGKDSFFGVSSAMEVYYTICEGLSESALEESVNCFPFSLLSNEATLKKLESFFDNKDKLSAHSSCIITKPIEVKQNFVDTVEKKYGFNKIELYDKPEEQQLAFCNDLIFKYTKGKIKNFFNSLEDFQNCALVLLNIVHFKLSWLSRFKKEDTMEKLFDNTAPVQMMSKIEHLNTYKENDFKMFEKDLESGLSMFFIRPEDNSLSLIREINSKEGKFTKLMDSFHAQKKRKICRIEVPRFEIRTRNDLVHFFKENGVSKMFEFGNHLSKMSDEDLKVGKFIQEACIDLNEEGIEVACVTAAMMMMKACFGVPKFEEEIILDKPFIYGISKGKTVLFIGVCSMCK